MAHFRYITALVQLLSMHMQYREIAIHNIIITGLCVKYQPDLRTVLDQADKEENGQEKSQDSNCRYPNVWSGSHSVFVQEYCS